MRRKTLVLGQYLCPYELRQALDANGLTELSAKSKVYAKILDMLRTVEDIDLSELNYVKLLDLALYLEEYQQEKDVKLMLCKRRINRTKNSMFLIKFDDQENNRIRIYEGDLFDVIDVTTHEKYTLKVRKVGKTRIVARDLFKNPSLNDVYRPKNLYDVHISFQNYPFRCQHLALSLSRERNAITYLFPDKFKPFINTEYKTHDSLTMVNPDIEKNPEQKQAVTNIVHKSSYPVPYILYGPPGTGKTATLVEAIVQIRKASSLNRVLVCTPSNTAANEIASRLLTFIPTEDVCRMCDKSRIRPIKDKQLLKCINSQFVSDKAILVSTLCNATKIVLQNLDADYFSHVIIDEAGQGTEPEVLIAISTASNGVRLCSQIVLAGDPRQLGPTVTSNLANKIMGKSILERLMSYDIYQRDIDNKYNPKYVTKLLRNYRSHPSIIHISNRLFYNNELIARDFNDDKTKSFPIIFHGVQGTEKRLQKSTSFSSFNCKEISMVLQYVYDLIDNKTEFGQVSAKDIGILTPFKLQSLRIQQILQNKQMKEDWKLLHKKKKVKLEEKRVVESENERNEANDGGEDVQTTLRNNQKDKTVKSDNRKNTLKSKYNFRNINVGTVNEFQGQERKIIIMTAVRSKTFVHEGKEHSGFLSNCKLFNVAMTRAQNALIVIGNPYVLQKDHNWQYLLKYCSDNQSYRGLPFTLEIACSQKPDVSESLSVATSTSLFVKQLEMLDINRAAEMTSEKGDEGILDRLFDLL